MKLIAIDLPGWKEISLNTPLPPQINKIAEELVGKTDPRFRAQNKGRIVKELTQGALEQKKLGGQLWVFDTNSYEGMTSNASFTVYAMPPNLNASPIDMITRMVVSNPQAHVLDAGQLVAVRTTEDEIKTIAPELHQVAKENEQTLAQKYRRHQITYIVGDPENEAAWFICNAGFPLPALPDIPEDATADQTLNEDGITVAQVQDLAEEIEGYRTSMTELLDTYVKNLRLKYEDGDPHIPTAFSE